MATYAFSLIQISSSFPYFYRFPQTLELVSIMTFIVMHYSHFLYVCPLTCQEASWGYRSLFYFYIFCSITWSSSKYVMRNPEDSLTRKIRCFYFFNEYKMQLVMLLNLHYLIDLWFYAILDLERGESQKIAAFI